MAERGAGELPVLPVSAVADAVDPVVLRTVPSETLVRFLMAQRWFGAKGETPRSARIADAVRLPWADGAFAIALVEVEARDGRRLLYQLPVGVRPKNPGTDAQIIAPVATEQGDTGVLFDAVADPEFLACFATALGRGDSFDNTTSMRWEIRPEVPARVAVPADASIRVGTAEQSNTSIFMPPTAIAKLFRRVEPGINPDLELTRYLTIEAGFPNTPALLGSVLITRAGEATMAAGIVQELVTGAKDAWGVAVDCARDFLAHPDAEGPMPFTNSAERLGIVTRAMHDALAASTAPDLAPEAASVPALREWGSRARRAITESTTLLDRSSHPARTRLEGLGARSGQRVSELLALVSSDAGSCMRTHGDYHLGQVLRTASDEFMVIDFEGEPARSLEDRRMKVSPLRDVAGMLRSFAYAGAVASTDGDDVARELAGQWSAVMRDAFLRGYLADRGGAAATYLPVLLENIHALIALFELEKAYYELGYEINNRPDWVDIPLEGIRRITTSP